MIRFEKPCLFSLLPALLLAACATPIAPPVWQPTPAESLSGALTLEQCLQLAFASDVRLAQWRSRLASAEASVDISNEIPNPSFSATWEDVGLHDATGAHLATAAYGLTFPFLYWLSSAPPEVAEAQFKSSAASIAEDRRQLRRDIGAAFFELAAAQRREAFQREEIETASAAQRLTSESLKLGVVSRHASLQASAESLQARSDLYAAMHELRTKGLELAFALGADRPVAVRVNDSGTSSSSVLHDLPTTGTLPAAVLERAVAADPTAAKAVADRETAEASIDLARESAWPFSEIQGSAERKNEPDGMGNNFSLEIPLPFFNRHEGEIAKAIADWKTAQAAEEQARRDVLHRLSIDWENYLYTSARYFESALPLIGMRRLLVADGRALFAAGAIEFDDLLQTQRDLAAAETTGVDAQKEYESARWNLICDLTPVEEIQSPGAGDGAKE